MKQKYLLRMYYFFYFQAIGFLIPFLPLHLASRSFSSDQIGLILSIGPLVMIFSQPLWGIWTDNYLSPQKTLKITMLMALITVWGYYIFNLAIFLIFAAIIFFFFQSPITPISDSLILANLEKNTSNFGIYRLWGSIGFAFGVIIMGKILEFFSTIWIFSTYGLVLLISLFVALKIPEKRKNKNSHLNFSTDIKRLFTDKKIIYFLLFGFLVQTSFGANNSFFSLFFKYLGGNTGSLGWAWALAALSEVPIFSTAQKALHKFPHKKLLCFAALIYGMRWLIHNLITNPSYLLIISLTQGLTFGIFYFAAVDFINTSTPSSIKTTGQTIFGAICFGLGPMTGSLMAGLLVNWKGYEFMYTILGIVCILAAVIYYRTE